MSEFCLIELVQMYEAPNVKWKIENCPTTLGFVIVQVEDRKKASFKLIDDLGLLSPTRETTCHKLSTLSYFFILHCCIVMAIHCSGEMSVSYALLHLIKYLGGTKMKRSPIFPPISFRITYLLIYFFLTANQIDFTLS